MAIGVALPSVLVVGLVAAGLGAAGVFDGGGKTGASAVATPVGDEHRSA